MKTLLFCILFSAIIACGGLMAGCSHGSPSGQTRPPAPPAPSGPTEPDRPGAGEGYPFEGELRDDEWRYTGRGTELRYGRGGVLVAWDGETVRFEDLDGATSVKATIGPPGPDSICRKTALEVNGRPAGLIRIKLMHRSDRSVWYEVTDTDSARHVIVAPA